MLWIEEDARRLERGDLEAVRHFLRAFGGMGSINDLVISPESGHHVTDAEIETANKVLREALSEAWSLARTIVTR